MKILQSTRCLVMMVTGLILLAGISVQAGGPTRCIVCGMDVTKYPHTRYVVKTVDGKDPPPSET